MRAGLDTGRDGARAGATVARLRRPAPAAAIAGQGDTVMPTRLAAFHLGDYGLSAADGVALGAYREARLAWAR